MKKRFYNAVYSKAKQQRPTSTEKTNKKQVNQNRKKKQTNQSARARNKEPFLWETYFRGSDKRKFARSFWND